MAYLIQVGSYERMLEMMKALDKAGFKPTDYTVKADGIIERMEDLLRALARATSRVERVMEKIDEGENPGGILAHMASVRLAEFEETITALKPFIGSIIGEPTDEEIDQERRKRLSVVSLKTGKPPRKLVD